MPNAPHAALQPALAWRISDRAFRLYCYFVLSTSGGWMTVPAVAAAFGLKPHQVRAALTELWDAELIEKDRRYEKGSNGRKTWRVYFRLEPDNATGEAAA